MPEPLNRDRGPAPEGSTPHGADPADNAAYDVAILGAHFAPATLAAILARNGLRVLLLDMPDDSTEPAGEATVPYTSEVFALIAERFDLPEIAAFAHFPDLPREIREQSGTKKSLSFLYHQPGARHEPVKTVQFNVPGEHNELHIYRPAANAYMREVAVGYGARMPEGDAVVHSATTTADHAVVTLADGRKFRAGYLVDAAGPNSPALAGLGVTVRTDALRLRSRVLTTRMAGVRPFENCVRLADYHTATPMSDGTTHHLFDGGWIQLVDFGNHAESTNKLCGVTLAVDPDRFKDLPEDPESAFRELVGRYPSIARQFEGATTADSWQTGEPWQRTASVTHGPRWFAMERSAARTEELLSRDVTMGLEVLHALAAGLLKVLRNNAPAEAEFARIARFQGALVDFNDQLLAGVRTASRDFQLWNAFSRAWLLYQILGDLSLKRARMDAAAEGQWDPVEMFEGGGLWFRTPAGLAELLTDVFAELERVRTGSIDARSAARKIFRIMGRKFVPPLYRFADPEARYYHFTLGRRLLMLGWVKTVAPRDFRRLLTRDNVTGRRLPPVVGLPSEPPASRPAALAQSAPDPADGK